MPTNLYGPNDNYDLEKSHVLPALIRKIHLGKCLEENNLDAIRKDMNKRPVEGTDGSADQAKILEILSKYGINAVKNSDKVRAKNESNGTNVSVEIWGSGSPLREFLWSEELADACVFLIENVDFKDLADFSQKEIRNTHINIGTGKEISIKDLAFLIKERIGFKGDLYFNTSKPDGTLRKLTDVSKLHSLGWHHKIEINEGIERMYNWYLV
jgi:GDP-L-fucose synthase